MHAASDRPDATSNMRLPGRKIPPKKASDMSSLVTRVHTMGMTINENEAVPPTMANLVDDFIQVSKLLM